MVSLASIVFCLHPLFQSLAPIPTFPLTFRGKLSMMKYMEALARRLKPWPCSDKCEFYNLGQIRISNLYYLCLVLWIFFF